MRRLLAVYSTSSSITRLDLLRVLRQGLVANLDSGFCLRLGLYRLGSVRQQYTSYTCHVPVEVMGPGTSASFLVDVYLQVERKRPTTVSSPVCLGGVPKGEMDTQVRLARYHVFSRVSTSAAISLLARTFSHWQR